MKPDFIEKLPPDAQKEFLKLAMKLDEKTKQEKVHKDFLAFVRHVWPEFIEGKHHKKISEKFNKLAKGEIKRLFTSTLKGNKQSRVMLNKFISKVA